MKSIHGIAIAALTLAAMPLAQAQSYGPEDEGRRFSDGSRVVCDEVEVRRGSGDPNRIAGTAAGAVIGGVIGSQVGSGSGRDLATVGGAIAGGAVGRKVQGNSQERRGDRVVEQRCERVWR
ncbi:glycine zipper 2TM domain-containing protein [Luteimonas sp. SDU101]|uniref:glycine zipper 2TM domain-containing protein n=1 Tax=Luteimonas sp. SDU101 TaxID=3422593 RepID=UPI003EB71279